MKKAIILIFILLSIIPYLIFFNLLSARIYNNISYQDKTTGENEIGINDAVSVEVKHKNLYGTYIKSYNQKNKVNNLYLLNLIKIPISVNDIPLWIFHILFSGIIFISFLFVLILYKEKKDYDFLIT